MTSLNSVSGPLSLAGTKLLWAPSFKTILKGYTPAAHQSGLPDGDKPPSSVRAGQVEADFRQPKKTLTYGQAGTAIV